MQISCVKPPTSSSPFRIVDVAGRICCLFDYVCAKVEYFLRKIKRNTLIPGIFRHMPEMKRQENDIDGKAVRDPAMNALEPLPIVTAPLFLASLLGSWTTCVNNTSGWRNAHVPPIKGGYGTSLSGFIASTFNPSASLSSCQSYLTVSPSGVRTICYWR